MEKEKLIKADLNSIKEIRSLFTPALVIFICVFLIKGIYDFWVGDLEIWGDKTIAVFDVWSFEHLLSGASLSYLLLHFSGPYTRAMQITDRQAYLQVKEIIKNAKLKERFDFTKIKKVFEEKTVENKILHHSLIVLVVVLMWEITEFYGEIGFFGQGIKYWWAGVESFINRLGSDTILVLLGWRMVRGYPTLAAVAAPISVLFLMIHIVVFPHSMFLHEASFEQIINELMSIKTIIAFGIAGCAYAAVTFFKKKNHNKYLHHLRETSF
ncbi:MAG: hypothetical protein KAS07_01600 [Candidatus Pacebacteria bacterium]|nr:hypothetical protein [Candidatus Paceibacterota bacterium]